MSYKEYIEYIFSMVKIIWKKGEAVVIVENGYLFCIDTDQTMLYQIKLNVPLEFNLCTYYSFIKSYVSSNDCNMIPFSFYEYSILHHRITNIKNEYDNCKDIHTHENIHTDEDYSKYFYLKSSDPSFSIIKDNIVIPIFYGMVPLSKGDALDLYLAKINSQYSIIKYTVIKKNNKDIIDIYMNILNLI